MEQYRGVVKKHTSFTLDLLRISPDGSTYRYISNFRCASLLTKIAAIGAKVVQISSSLPGLD